MSFLFNAVVIFLAIALVVGMIIAGIYNNLIRKRNMVDNAFYSIDVQLKKRYDLIPSLVETVKGYMHHEKDLLTSITELRTRALGSNDLNDKVKLANDISKGIGQLLVSVENYPDLKASQNFLHLQASLNETEEQLAASRRFYNSAVAEYHNALQQFPSSIIAKKSGMQPREYFSVPDGQQAPQPISFN